MNTLRTRKLAAWLGIGFFGYLSSLPLYAAPLVPPGFTVSLVSKNLTGPTHIEFAPDGRIFVSLKAGHLRIIKDGVLLPTPFLSVDTDTAGEHGLIGVAFDPAFATNSYLYVYYIAKTPNIHGRVSRFTANGDVAVADSEKIILELEDRGKSIFHVAGDLHFGKDGKLYVASGDNAGYPFTNNSQRLTSTLGKLLRINSDGSIPSDNPFIHQTTGVAQSIWSYGLRNPFSFSFSKSGRLFVNDVGQTSWEEINDATLPGGNYGWPLAEGMSADPQFKNPVATYAHGAQADDTLGCAITGGAFYEPIIPQFPAQYAGKYFFIDFCNSWVHTLDPATGVISPFAKNITSNGLGITLSPDGSLYFLSAWLNAIYKISFSGTPAPQFISDPADQVISVGQPVTWSVSVSGSQPLSYQWRKNGVPIASANTNTYGIDAVTLADDGAQYDCVVSNSYGSTTSRAGTLKVLTSIAPTVSMDYPEVGFHYNAGDRVYFGASATESTGEGIPASSFTWNIYFHHEDHFHPFLSNKTGTTAGYFQIPVLGEPSVNTWFRLVLSVKNSQGLATTLTREIHPSLSQFLLKSHPPGLQLILDGQPILAPSYTQSVVGYIRGLGVASPQTLNGVTYQFDSWSDGGPENHSIRTSVSNRTYTANFIPVGSTRRGTLSASPNPALVCDGSGAGTTTLIWNSTGTTSTEIRINAPDGNLLAASPNGSGSITTQKWIGNESTFYLQDTSGELPLTLSNTLATVTVNLTDAGCNSLRRSQKRHRLSH